MLTVDPDHIWWAATDGDVIARAACAGENGLPKGSFVRLQPPATAHPNLVRQLADGFRTRGMVVRVLPQRHQWRW